MNEESAMFTVEDVRPSLWRRLVCWLLPVKHPMIPSQDEIGFETEDVVFVDTCTVFDFWDRVRILFAGSVATSVRVVTENKPGRIHTVVATYVTTESRERRQEWN